MNKFNFFNMVADESDVDIKLYGEIISDDLKELYEWFGINTDNKATASGFKKLLDEHKDKNLTIHVNSVGGDFLVGLEIYNALKEHKGHKTGVIDALAASAATIPLCACDIVKMPAASTLMIHCVSTLSNGGNRIDLQKDVDMLKSMDDTLANIYELKTGLKHDKILNLMEKESWFDCKQAKKLGFADEIDDKLDIPKNIIQNIIENNKRLVACYRGEEQPLLPEPANTDNSGEGSKPQNKKFTSVEALEKAYSDLQAEFTRKSQKLSEIEAKNKNQAPQPKQTAEDPQTESSDILKARFIIASSKSKI